MPPTRWKQEEEEGKANHRQTLNSLTPSRLQTAPLAFPSGTAGLLLALPRFCKQPSSILPWRSIAPKAEPGFPSDQCVLCPEHLPQAPPEHGQSSPTVAAPPPGPSPREAALTPPPLGSLLLQQLRCFPGCSLAPHRSLQVGNAPLGSQVLEASTDTRGPRLGPKALFRGVSSKEKHPIPARCRALS